MRRGLIRARVIAPDFSVHELDPNTITEAPARGGDYKTYSDGKRLRAPFSGDCSRGGRRGRVHGARDGAAFRSGHVGRIVFGQERVPVEHSRAVFDAAGLADVTHRHTAAAGFETGARRGKRAGYAHLRPGSFEGMNRRKPNLRRMWPHIPEIAFFHWTVVAGMAASIQRSSIAGPMRLKCRLSWTS